MALGTQVILTTDFSTVKAEGKKKKKEMGSLPKWHSFLPKIEDFVSTSRKKPPKETLNDGLEFLCSLNKAVMKLSWANNKMWWLLPAAKKRERNILVFNEQEMSA